MMEVYPTEPIPDTLLDQPTFSVPPEIEARIDELITHYPQKRSASLMLLHAIQEQFGFISRQAVEWDGAHSGAERRRLDEARQSVGPLDDDPMHGSRLRNDAQRPSQGGRRQAAALQGTDVRA